MLPPKHSQRTTNHPQLQLLELNPRCSGHTEESQQSPTQGIHLFQPISLVSQEPFGGSICPQGLITCLHQGSRGEKVKAVCRLSKEGEKSGRSYLCLLYVCVGIMCENSITLHCLQLLPAEDLSFSTKKCTLMQQPGVPAMGGCSPERPWVKQSHPNGPQRGAKAWEINTEGQFRLERGMHSTPQMWCAGSRQGGTMHLRRGATGTSFLHPLWILLPFPVTPTQPVPVPHGRAASPFSKPLMQLSQSCRGSL